MNMNNVRGLRTVPHSITHRLQLQLLLLPSVRESNQSWQKRFKPNGDWYSHQHLAFAFDIETAIKLNAAVPGDAFISGEKRWK